MIPVCPGDLVTPPRSVFLGAGPNGSGLWTKLVAEAHQGDVCLVLAVMDNEAMVLTPQGMGWFWASAFIRPFGAR